MLTPFPAIADRLLSHIPDKDLLRRFAQNGDHAAFELLVWRHRRLVLGLCRRVAGNSHDAEDAFQATFLVLARRADAVRGANVAGWLAGVAYRCATRVRTRRRDHLTADLSTVPAAEPSAHDPDISAALDAELARLPEKYRLPIVLYYLSGKTYEQVAAELNCPVGTLSGRLTRAKALLRKRLTRRGLTLSGGGLAACLDALGPPAAAADGTIQSIASAAVAFAGGETLPGPATAVANGVLHMMTWKSNVLPAVLVAVTLFLGLTAAGVPSEPPKPPVPGRPAGTKMSDEDRLQGVWVFDAAAIGKGNMLGMAWESKLTITGNAVRVDGFLGLKRPLKGTVRLDPTADPKRFDLELEEFDLAEGGLAMKIPAAVYPGIYELVGSHVRIRLNAEVGGKRPDRFDAAGQKMCGITLVKAPEAFTAFPKEIRVKVIGLDGRPASGVIVTKSIVRRLPAFTIGADGVKIEPSQLTAAQRKEQDERDKLPNGWIYNESSGWSYADAKMTGPDGTVVVPYQAFAGCSIIGHDPKNQIMGITCTSPATLLGGTATVTLRPACRVSITASAAGMTKADEEKKGSGVIYNAWVMTPDGRAIAMIQSWRGNLEYSLPPGEYQIDVIGGRDFGRKTTAFTVPENRTEYTAPPVVVPMTGMKDRVGRPALELSDVVAWKGTPVKLADLKGKIVLLHFWGYWCGQCIQEMPILMELHDAFKSQGVVIVGVHIDAEGEVDSSNVLDEKMAINKKDLWKGRDIPFPVALTSGKRASEDENAGRGPLAEKYGIRGYPRTLIIDRDGKVVGDLNAHDLKAATARLEYLLTVGEK